MTTLQDLRKHFHDLGKTEVPVLLDATDAVPWKDVVHVLDLCKRHHFSQIKFVEPMEVLRR